MRVEETFFHDGVAVAVAVRRAASLSAVGGGFELHFEFWPSLRRAALRFCAELDNGLLLTGRAAARHADITENDCACTRGARKTGGSALPADGRVSR